MKKITSLLAVSVVALLATPAHAAFVPTPAIESVGTLSAPDAGNYTAGVTTDKFYTHEISGGLNTMSKITFTYALTGVKTLSDAYLQSLGNIITAPGISAAASADSAGDSDSNTSSDSLIVATAAMDTDFSGTTTITNLSNSRIINFKSTLMAYLSNRATMTVSYVVQAVPLPAALPLFGLGIAALAGFRAKKKAQASA